MKLKLKFHYKTRLAKLIFPKMADDTLPMSVCLYVTNKYLDSVIAGNKSNLDLALILSMCSAYKDKLGNILPPSDNEHQNLSNNVFKLILDKIMVDKKLPNLGGLEDQLIVLMAKAFKVQLANVNVNGKYNLIF